MGEESAGMMTLGPRTGTGPRDLRKETEERRLEKQEKERKNSEKEGRKDEATLEQEVNTLRTEIEEIRDDLGLYVSELDRRRHNALDLRLQFRKHRELVVSVGVGLAALGGALLAWRVTAKRRMTFTERLGESLKERVRRDDRRVDLVGTLGKAVIGIAAGAAATALKNVVEKKMKRAPAAAD